MSAVAGTNGGHETAAGPAVSVIVSTYNWSGALRCALRSVQLQTLRNIEVLVVGDGCTDDSEAVVRDLGDDRFRWHNLPANSGSQSAPNNFGVAAARAAWVAYLGQDDIWHPRHLEACLAAAEAQQADLVAAVAIMYGPPGSGWRAMSGLLVDGAFGPRDFMPPSSWLHRTGLAAEAGFWRRPEDTPLPADAAFLKDVADSGARIGATDEVTVFKFNAAWRRDAYRLKPTAEQEAMLEKIESGEAFRERELLDVMRSVAADRYIAIAMPQPVTGSDLSYFRRNRLHKGAEARFAPDQLAVADRTRRFAIEEPGHFQWHAPETHPVHGSFRWTGPSPKARVTLPVLLDRPLQVDVNIVNVIEPAVLDRLALSIGETRVPFSLHARPDGSRLLRCVPVVPPQDPGPLEIEFDIGRTRRPVDVMDSRDRRWLGLALAWIEVGPA